MKQTEVKLFHIGDLDFTGNVLYIAKSKKQALEYVQDWLNVHSTKAYSFHKVTNMNRWESKFTAIYF